MTQIDVIVQHLSEGTKQNHDQPLHSRKINFYLTTFSLSMTQETRVCRCSICHSKQTVGSDTQVVTSLQEGANAVRVIKLLQSLNHPRVPVNE